MEFLVGNAKARDSVVRDRKTMRMIRRGVNKKSRGSHYIYAQRALSHEWVDISEGVFCFSRTLLGTMTKFGRSFPNSTYLSALKVSQSQNVGAVIMNPENHRDPICNVPA